MENWKFLLQKEGDRSWLPLDSPDVEILEGRYRVVARSSQTDTEVEVRISHLATGEDPPKRRIQKRSNRTNPEGLMVVIPFTRLQPGIWELCCSSLDLMSDLLGDSWQYAVKLQVLAREAEGEEWEPDWSPAAIPVSSQEEFSESSESFEAVEPTISPAVASTDQPDANSTSTEIAAASPLTSSGNPDNRDQPDELDDLGTIASPAIPVSSTEPKVTTDEPVPLSPEVAEILGASMDRLFQIAEQMSNQLVDEVLRDFDLMPPLEDSPHSQLEAIEPESADESINPEPVTSDFTETLTVGSIDASSGYTFQRDTTLSFRLDQEAFVACRGEALTLSGQVEVGVVPDSEPSEASETSHPFDQSVQYFSSEIADPWVPSEAALSLAGATAQELQLYLRDPQSLQVLVSDRLPLTDQSPPFPFSFSFSLPSETTTHLILGEVLLCGFLPSRQGSLSTLITQAFTITVDPKELVGELTKLSGALDETLANHPDEEDRIDLPLELSNHLEKEKEKELSLNLSFLDPELTETPPVEQPSRFASLAGQPLPPQLYQPDPNQAHSKPIELPDFALPATQPEADLSTSADQAIALEQEEQTDSTPDELGELFSLPEPAEVTVAEPAESVAELGPIAAINAPQPTELELAEPSVSTPDDQPVESPAVESEALDRQVLNGLSDADDSTEAEEDSTSINLPSPVQMGFQALKLQDRFLTRLSSLASDAELSVWLRSHLDAGKVSAAPKASSSAAAEAERVAKEVVVNDDEPASQRGRRHSGSKHSEERSKIEDEPNVLILPKDEPIPLPKLEVTNGELVSGALVNIRVKLPNLIPRMYVKLWVTDRQTRSLLDGPRWLLDFLPNGLGDMEAFTQLTVPFGSLEIRFEAIAIEMHTQRESHKASIDRDVVPPDLPIMSLEDFEP